MQVKGKHGDMIWNVVVQEEFLYFPIFFRCDALMHSGRGRISSEA